MYVSSSNGHHFDPLRFCRPPSEAHAERHALIAKAAYMHAQRRSFRFGHALDDWLTAEAEIEQLFVRSNI
jgi:hypothetical protein